MELYSKRLFSNKLKEKKENCHTCRGPAKMYSTGYAYLHIIGKPTWILEFECEVCHDLTNVGTNKYHELVIKIIEEDNPEIEDV